MQIPIRATIDSILISRLCGIHNGKTLSYAVTRAVEYYVKEMEVEEPKFQFLRKRNKWPTRIWVDINEELINQLYEIHKGVSLSHALTYAIKYYVEVMEVFMEAKKLEKKEIEEKEIEAKKLEKLELYNQFCDKYQPKKLIIEKKEVEEKEIEKKEVFMEEKKVEEIKYQPRKLISANVDLELYNQLREMNREMNVSDCVRRAVKHHVECEEINKYIIEVDVDYDLSEQLIERYMGYSLSHVLTCAIVHYTESANIRDEIAKMNRYLDDGKKSVAKVRFAIIPDLINRLGEVHDGDSISEALNCAIKYYLELDCVP